MDGRNFCRMDTSWFVADHHSRPRHQKKYEAWKAWKAVGEQEASTAIVPVSSDGGTAANPGSTAVNPGGGADVVSGCDQDGSTIVSAQQSVCTDVELLACSGYPVGSGTSTVDRVQSSASEWIVLSLMQTVSTKTSKARHGSFEARDFVLYLYAPTCKLPHSSSGTFVHSSFAQTHVVHPDFFHAVRSSIFKLQESFVLP